MLSEQSHFSLFSLKYCLLIVAAMLSGCSTVTEGSSQKIAVHSVPEGANCFLKSNDEIIAEVPSTPEVVVVPKSKYDIIVECTKEGYIKGKNKNHSDFAISSLGNMVFGQFGVVGNMVDSATGAANKYDSQVFVELEKDTRDPTLAQASAPPAVQLSAQPPVAAPQQIAQILPSTSASAAVAPQAATTLIPQMPTQQLALQTTHEFPADFAVPEGAGGPPFDMQ